jgi:hypothetical protein
MRLARRLAAAAAVCATFLGVGLGVADSAGAATGDLSWTGRITGGSATAGTATVVWNPKTYGLTLKLTTGALAAGRCVTVYFDWTSRGHHDARSLRDCRSADTVSYAFKDPNPSNIAGGVNKLGVCYGVQNKLGACVIGHGTHKPAMDWSRWPDATRTAPCDLSWVRRNADGTISSFIDPHAQLDELRPYASC